MRLIGELNCCRLCFLYLSHSSSLLRIIVHIHRPLYCSSSHRECDIFGLYLRTKLEGLFQKYLVDLVFQAHRHNYERTTPVFNEVVMPPSEAPVYILNGIGGCREGNNGGLDSAGPAWRVIGYDRAPNSTGTENLFGYGILTVTNTTLSYQQYLDENSHPIDQFVIKPRLM